MFGESGTSFKDIDGFNPPLQGISCCWFDCVELLKDEVLWEAAKFLRFFSDSLFVIAVWELSVGGQFQLLIELVDGDDEINPFPLNLPRDVREWACIEKL